MRRCRWTSSFESTRMRKLARKSERLAMGRHSLGWPQTTAPEFSSFGSLSFLTGLTMSSRLMPSHMATAAPTNTYE